MKIITTRELAWAAGLFEGEGCFYISRRPSYPSAALEMTDEDAVKRFASAVGVGLTHLHANRGFGMSPKPLWRWQTNGFEKVQAIVGLLWFGLGERRRTRAKEVLAGHRNTLRLGEANRRKTHCPHGHPYDADNTCRCRGGRHCLTCKRERSNVRSTAKPGVGATC